ncbi:SdiA-regulated domain-containing protein [Nitrospira sp. M1]
MAKKLLGAIVIIGLVTLTLPISVSAITLDFQGAFDFDGADGIAFNPTSGNLFLAQTFFDINDDAIQTRVVEVTTSGTEVLRFNPELHGLSDVQGLSFLPSPNANLLLTEQDSPQGGVLEFTTTGDPVPLGINFSTLPTSDDGDGVIFHSGTNTVFIADDLTESIYEFDTTGTHLNTISTPGILSDFIDPEGITFDPETGNLLVVDAVAGTRSLYELTTAGALVSSVDLEALTGFADPEGVTIDRSTNTLYVAFDRDDKIGAFSIQPSQPIPEPSTGWLVGPVIVGLLTWRMRQTRKNSA